MTERKSLPNVAFRAMHVLVYLFILVACKEEGDVALRNMIDTPTFTIETPEGWTLIRQQGYDSHVGKITGPLGTLYFDQGYFSHNDLDHISQNERTVYFQRMLVNGDSAILHKEKALIINNDNIRTTLSMYIQEHDGLKRNHLYVHNPNSITEQIMVEIMKTHRFK